jgi:Protein of unknown function (DUF1579)
MSVSGSFRALTGSFRGRKKLWVRPGEPVRESESSAQVSVAANGKFLHISYTWKEGELQQGLLIIGVEDDGQTVSAAWIDSWHNGDRMMVCRGGKTPSGGWSVRGSYPAPPGPDWGWRIEIQPGSGSDKWQLSMFNATPDGQEMLAVEVNYLRT